MTEYINRYDAGQLQAIQEGLIPKQENAFLFRVLSKTHFKGE